MLSLSSVGTSSSELLAKTNGYESSNTFQVSGPTTNKVVDYIMVNNMSFPASAQGSKLQFTDVAADAYYAAPVNWAVEKGIASGTSATTFSPDNTCTRAQILTFLLRASNN